MSTHIESKITYVVFDVKSNVFAIPINETLGIIQLTQNVPQIILPGAKNYVKCIVEVDGLLITVINMPGTDGDMLVAGDLIVVLEHTEQRIGISANGVCLVTVSAEEILDDKVSGAKVFVHGEKTCSILDDGQFYKYMGI